MLTSLKILALKIISPIILASLAFQGVTFAPTSTPSPTPAQNLGAFNVTGGSSYRLQSSIGLSDTSINLASFKEPVSNVPYTMTYIGSSVAYATLDPQTLTKSEFVSFTGITQNSDGTARLTGVTRGLSRTPGTGGCVASTTLAQSHSGQSFLVLSNSPCFYSEFAVLKNDQTITGDWQGPAPANTSSFVTRSYVDGKVFSGIGGASETATGTVEIATQLETASSTTNGTLGRLVIPSSLSTSTWNNATSPNRIVVTDNNGFIDNSFTRLGATSTSADNIAALDAVVFPDVNDGLTVASTTAASSQYFSVTDTVPLSVIGNLTLEVWVKPFSYAGSGGVMDIIAKSNGAANTSYSLAIGGNCSPGNPQCLLFRMSQDGTNNATLLMPISLPLKTWTHLAVVYNASTTATSTPITVPQQVSIYINGNLASSTATNIASIFDANSALEIGHMTVDAGNGFWNGQLSDVRIWNVPRTSNQIRENYNRRLNGTESGLAGYWKLNGTLFDSTANAATLTNNAAATFIADGNGNGSTLPTAGFQPMNISTTTVVRASASNSTTTQRFVGFAERAATPGSQIRIILAGFVRGFSGLNAGSIYYLGDTPGTINPFPSAFNTKQIGLALSTSTLLITR